MKQVICIVAIIALLVGAILIEQSVIDKTFDELNQKTAEMIEKLQAGQLKKEDVEKLTDWWNTKKETLHAIIPHNDIRELDSHFSLAESYVDFGYVTHAFAQFEVLFDLSISLPKTYKFSFENIF